MKIIFEFYYKKKIAKNYHRSQKASKIIFLNTFISNLNILKIKIKNLFLKNFDKQKNIKNSKSIFIQILLQTSLNFLSVFENFF